MKSTNSQQHQDVITAAKGLKIGWIAYTSLLHAASSPLRVQITRERCSGALENHADRSCELAADTVADFF